MPVIFIRHIGANLAFVEPLGAVDPGFGVGPGGGDPGYGHPIFGRPGHDLPWAPGRPGHDLPVPPMGPPPQVNPGEVVVLIRDQAGVWHYAALAPSSPPPRPVPVPPPEGEINPKPPGIDNTLPGQMPPHVSGQPIVPPNPNHPSGQPVPPMPAPTRR